jgi:hypothetical protein
MPILVTVIGGLAAVAGLIGVVRPDLMKQLAVRFRTPAGMYAAIGIRIVVGALLVWAGPACRPETPWVGWTVRAIGLLAIVVALGLLLSGRARFEALAEWSLGRPAFLRGTSVIALAVGAFLIYAGM